MAAPAPPTTDPIPPTADFAFRLTLEASLADLATLDAYADGLVEIGSDTPAGFTNAIKFTLSRKVPVHA